MSSGIEALVIGGDGLVGQHLVRALSGRPLIVTTRPGTEGTAALDVTDGRALQALVRAVRPTTVVLAAAMGNAERCEEDPVGSAAVNVGAARAAAEAASDTGSRLVVFSSEYVFPGGGGRYREWAPVGPINEYGRQKVALERVAATVSRYLVVRTSGVFGWEPARKNFVCGLTDRLRHGERAIVPNDQVITPTYAPDLADALVCLMDLGADGIVNVVGPTTLERLSFAMKVASAFGLPTALIEGRQSAAIGYRARRPLECGLDDSLLRSLLGRGLRPPDEALAHMHAKEAETN